MSGNTGMRCLKYTNYRSPREEVLQVCRGKFFMIGCRADTRKIGSLWCQYLCQFIRELGSFHVLKHRSSKSFCLVVGLVAQA